MTLDETDRIGGPLAKAIVAVTDPFECLRLTTYELAEALETDPDSVRDGLSEFSWAHEMDDDGIEWAFDRHVVFSESIEDALDSYPERYEEDDFYVR